MNSPKPSDAANSSVKAPSDASGGSLLARLARSLGLIRQSKLSTGETGVAAAVLKPYPCHNKPRPSTTQQLVQDGWENTWKRRMIKIESEWIEQGCTHLDRTRDSQCENCIHQA